MTYSAEVKAKAVLRVLRGEDAHTVARDLDVSTRRLAHWQEVFVEGGQAWLETKSHSHSRSARRRQTALTVAAFIALLLLALVVVTRLL